MSVLQEFDRPFLQRAYSLAREAKRPPAKLGQRPEPVWAAVVATPTQEMASAVFVPGDSMDAVKRLLEKYRPVDHSQDEVTLYLTLEPKAGFDRLPPVTESVRLVGVKRVVVGTLDPAQRVRGEGSRTLERMGVEVILADGEEARQCQQLLEDYAKWQAKGISVLRARVELRGLPDSSEGYDLKLTDASVDAPRADAILCRAGQRPVVAGGADQPWVVLLDRQGWERPSDRTVLYQGEEAAHVPGARRLAFDGDQPNLGALLRDLGSLGIVSVELCSDADLFRLALRSGLLDSVLARFPDSGDSGRALSHMSRVRLADGGEPVELRLDGARLLDEQRRCLEARVELR